MERRSIAVRGTVRGVGFQPFVHGLAARLDLAGCVRNQTGGVRTKVEGDTPRLDGFLSQLSTRPPQLARVDELVREYQPPRGDRAFHMTQSERSALGPGVISPDATCDHWLDELLDPRDRRFRYPFLHCISYDPRLTIVTGAPYDRARTMMTRFPVCPAHRQEYEDPTNRRFGARPLFLYGAAIERILDRVAATGQAGNSLMDEMASEHAHAAPEEAHA